MNGNSVEQSLQKAGHLYCREDRWRDTMMQAPWETRAVIPGMGDSSSHWMWGKACVGWSCCCSNVQTQKEDRWSWVGLNYCAARSCGS